MEHRDAPKWARLALLSAALIALDQGTKFLAVDRLTTALTGKTLPQKIAAFYGEDHLAGLAKAPFAVVKPLWHMTYAENPGAAWSLFASMPEGFRNLFFPLVSAIAVGVVLFVYRRLKPSEWHLRIALTLVLAGAVGNNLIDRLVHGYAIDFIRWHWWNQIETYWPIFNLADTFIVIGVAILVISPRRKAADERGAEGA